MTGLPTARAVGGRPHSTFMNPRFSGHETFPLRYAWLPKAYRLLAKNPAGLADEESAMVELGIGKNMVRALRFWVQATGVAEPSGSAQFALTDFAQTILGPEGADPYLEDIRTLWLLHWNLAARVEDPLFAWDFMLNKWQHPELTRSKVLDAFRREAERIERELSPVTLEQHFDVFLHTYVPTRGRKGDVQEDTLDSPLVELNLIVRIGEQPTDARGRREPVYAFRREPKPEISPELFAFALDQFWRLRRPSEGTLTFRDVAVEHGSPGQIFKLPEWDIRERLQLLDRTTRGRLRYEESQALERIVRSKGAPVDLLTLVYQERPVYA